MTSAPEVSGGRTIGKGLRHFSMKVCEKVESKGRTTYNEVADELVKDYSSPETTGAQWQACERAHYNLQPTNAILSASLNTVARTSTVAPPRFRFSTTQSLRCGAQAFAIVACCERAVCCFMDTSAAHSV
jgi:hypothetical protein